MKNGWKKLLIISLIIILLEVIGAVVVMLPFYARNMVFVNIEKGDAVKTKGYFDMLNEDGQDKVYDYLDDFAATICQDYIDGKKTYEETVASLDAIREIEGNNEIADRYIRDVASNEFKKILNESYEADMARDTNTSFNLQPKLDLVKQRLDNATREKLMISFLNEKYKSFLNEEITGEGISAVCTLVVDNAYYEAYDYAGVIASNAGCVVMYRNLYSELQEDMKRRLICLRGNHEQMFMDSELLTRGQMANRFLILKWLIALLRNEINERCNISLCERTCFRNMLAGFIRVIVK